VNRLRIVRRLAGGEASVTELIEEVGLSQPLVSWHVGRLRVAGLVATRRNGRETVCSLRREAYAAFVARERQILGLDGDTQAASGSVADATGLPGGARRVAAT
jgi:DNA-binding transcriptional ArsR family regulator